MKKEMKRQSNQETKESELTDAQLELVVGGAPSPSKLLAEILARVLKTSNELEADVARDFRG